MTPGNWLLDLDGACERSGDLPSIHGLRHFSSRVAEVQSNAHAQGISSRIEKVVQAVAGWVKPSQEAEIERLRRLIRETLA